MSMRLFFVMVSCLVASVSAATEVFTCTHEGGTSITWDMAAKHLSREISNATADLTMVLVVEKKKGVLKGNVGTADLTRINDYFLETTGMGNINLWRLVRGGNSTPTYLFSMKAYSLSGAVS